MKKRSTKLIAMIISLAMLMTCMVVPATAFGAETTATVTVLMDMGAGGEFSAKTLEVSSDAYVGEGNTEGKVTIADAAIASGFAAKENITNQEFGLAFTGLNNGSVGYYVNNKSAMSLDEEVKTGDHVILYLFDDAAGFSDTYYFFEQFRYAAEAGQELTLTLNISGYDASWNPVVTPGADRTVILTGADGKTVEAATDADGKAVFKDLAAGTYTASIASKGAEDYFVMPWAQATVEDPYKDIKKASVSANDLKLTVSTTAEGTAALKGIRNNSKKTVKVPAKVTVDGVEYDVTAIDAKAFKNCKKATKLVVPASVTMIRKNAFAGIKNLKTIQFKTKKSNITMKKGAYKGVKKSVIAKVPDKMKKAQVKKFKKAMKKAGFKGAVK